MELKIYYNGKIDLKNEIEWKLKCAFWPIWVVSDVVSRNKRIFYNPEEKEMIRTAVHAFASGKRKPF